MKSAEFLDWMSRARLMFAHVDELFRYTRQDGPERERMLANEWAMALRDVSADDAGAALDALRDGELKPPGSYRADWSTLPAIVRQYAREQQATREAATRKEIAPEWARPAPPRRQRTTGGLIDSIGLMRRLIGKNAIEARAIIDAEIPPSDELRQPRYKCPLCLDSNTGLMPIWRPWVVLYVREHWIDGAPDDWCDRLKDALHQNRLGMHFHVHVICSCDSYEARTKREAAERYEGDRLRCDTPVFSSRYQPYRDGSIERLVKTLAADPFAAVGAESWPIDYGDDETWN